MKQAPLSPRRLQRASARLLLTPCLALACGVVTAQSSPYYIGAAQTIAYNSNTIALRDNQAPPAGLSKSDTVFTTALVAGIDQPFGRQRLAGTANLNFNRYSRNNDFDSSGHTLRLALDWQTIERLSGRVAVSSDRALRADVRDANDQFILRSNAETANQLDASVSLGLVTRLSAEATFLQRDVRYSAAEAVYREYQQRSASLGLRYRPASTTTWGLGLRQTRWDYPNLLIGAANPNDRRTRDDLDASLVWQASGASSLDVRLSSGDTRYQQFNSRNFSGLTGSLGWDWQTGGKLRVNSRLSRDSGQDAERVTTAYTRTTDLLRISADYALSAKIGLNGALSLYSRLVEGRGANVTSLSGRENGNSLALGVRWTPVRSTLVGCNVSSDQLGANDNPLLSDKYGATGLSCFGQFVLQ
jgi:hypothetical protein